MADDGGVGQDVEGLGDQGAEGGECERHDLAVGVGPGRPSQLVEAGGHCGDASAAGDGRFSRW